MTYDTYDHLSAAPRWRVALIALCSIVFTAVSIATDTAKEVAFDIPAAAAAKALRQFSAQSGQQLIYANADLAAITTNELKGKMTVAAALVRLLAGTPLVASPDSKNGVVAIARASPEKSNPNARRAARTTASDRPNQQKVVAKHKSGSGETLAGASAGEETVTLTPFEVTTSKDYGYAATNTLAGSRVNTDLKDVPAAISIFNEAFLTDIAAANLIEAVEYGLGTREDLDEGRSGGPVGEIFNNDERPIRIRGLPGGSRTRNYFNQLGETDTYNKTRLEFSRGPNSVLYGFGSPAGVINASTKRAETNRDLRSFSAQFGMWDRQRYTTDLNQVLVKDKLALRINHLHQETESWRDFGHDDTDALHLAATWRIGRRTILRAEAEWIDNGRFRPRPWIANDADSLWRELGSPTYHNFQNANGTSRPVGSPFATFGQLPGIRSVGTFKDFVYNDGVAINWNNFGRSDVVGVFPETGFAVGTTIRNSFDFDFYHRPETVLEGPSMGASTDYRQLGATLEHEIINNLFVELAVDSQKQNRSAFNFDPADRFGLTGDPNQFRPDGSPNPYVGQYYISQTLRSDRSSVEQKSLRATLSYEKDLGFWFGRHRLGALGERRTIDDRFGIWREVWADVSDPANSVGAFNARLEHADNRVYRTVYFTPVQVASMQGVHWADWFNEPIGVVQMMDPTTANPTRTRAMEAMLIPAQGMRNHRRKNKAGMFITQNYWFKDRVVTTFGYREETARTWLSSNSRDERGVLVPFGYRDPNAEPKSKGITRNYGLVARPPFRALDWLSVFYNHSNAASESNVTSGFGLGGGTVLPRPLGITDDYGIRLDLFSGKLYANIARYKTAAENDSRPLSNLGQAFRVPIQALIDAGRITSAQFDPKGAGILTANDILNGQHDTFDSVSTGWEVELTYNPLRNWRIALNYAYQDAARTNDAPRLRQIVEALKPLMLSGDNPRVRINQDPATPEIDLTPTVFDSADGVMNVAEALRDAELTYLEQVGVFNGQAPNGHTRHRANLLTNYSFEEGFLKNFSIGGGVRYRSGTVGGFVLGDFTISNDLAVATSPNAGIDPGQVTRQFTQEDQLFFDMSVSYRRPVSLFGKKARWSVQLNVRNVLDETDRVITQVFIDGTPRQYRLVDPRQILLTNTISF